METQQIPNNLIMSLKVTNEILDGAPESVVRKLLRERVDEFNHKHNTTFSPKQVVQDYFSKFH